MAGSHFRLRAKMAMRITPVTNSGRPMKARADREMTWSTGLFCRRAAMSPNRIPTRTYMRSPTSASIEEFRSRWKTSGATGEPVLRDVPQLPLTKLPSHERYCRVSGRLSPSFSLKFFRAISVAYLPRIAVATSPGSTWVATKIRIDESRRKMRTNPRRRRMNRLMTGSPGPSRMPFESLKAPPGECGSRSSDRSSLFGGAVPVIRR